MKRNRFYLILLLICTLGMTSCNFLDIVPDEKEKAEDAFEDVNAARRYMYSCYAPLPNPRDGPGSLDFMTGDEVVSSFEHETFARFPKGTYTAAEPVISYWNTLFKGIRQCYMMLDGVEKVPGLEENVKTDYIAQCHFLIGYYHFLLAQSYGPIILIKSTPSIVTPASEYLPRSPYDECVQFICNEFDEAAKNLPAKRKGAEYNLATSVAAKAMKAKMLLYAASPLFNGNSKFYADFKDKQGNLLMPQQYDPQKWEKAKAAYKEAIELAEANGAALYTKQDYNRGNREPVDSVQHCLRYTIIDQGPNNPEFLWGDSRGEGQYGLQNKCLPYTESAGWNGIAPTLTMLKRFYTKNGLPIDVDPEYKTKNIFDVVTINNEKYGAVGKQTLELNIDREPRFYAWIAFQGGFYEIMNASNNGAYNKDASYKKYSNDEKGKLVCDFLKNGNCGKQGRSRNYSPSGYLVKKGIDPAYNVSTQLQSPPYYPWPIIRLAELYLGYAEAAVETNDLATAKTYINKVRERAGIPTVQESWENIAHLTLDQTTMRKIVRQERQIEFFMENQNFWDMRRWLEADKYFSKKAHGLNIESADIFGFAQDTEIVFDRSFSSPTNYLLPIPLSDVNKNLNVVQNPGY